MNECLGAIAVDLLPQPADEDVDRAVAVRLAAAPDLLQQLVAGDDAAAVERERVEEPELGRRQPGALAVDERLHLARVDAQLLDLDRVAAPLLGRTDAAAGGGADAGDELAHRERLHEVVVRADLERVHAVVLGAARGDDDDRRADPLGPRGLDQLPAVELRQHQVEHADVGVLEAQPRRARARRGRRRSGRSRRRRGGAPSRPRSRCRPRRSGSWPRPYDSAVHGSCSGFRMVTIW